MTKQDYCKGMGEVSLGLLASDFELAPCTGYVHVQVL